MPQQAHVFQDTLRNNLALGEDFTEDAMHEALRACCLTEFLAGLPNGLDEVLRDRYACSGGEAARLGLARAILRRPRVLICDEVTAHLDGATAQQIDALLTALPGVLLLNVSHKISEAAAGRYDEVLRLALWKAARRLRGTAAGARADGARLRRAANKRKRAGVWHAGPFVLRRRLRAARHRCCPARLFLV